MVEGEPTVDMIGVDPRRFGVVSKNFAKLKNEEAYEHVFIIHYPMEERPGCRPAKAPPCYDRLDAAGAVFGQRFGWERPNWFAPEGVERKDAYSFRRSNWFEPVGHEVRTIRENVGMIELSAFSKFEVEGPGARAFLDRLVANVIPKKLGGITLAHALNPSGSIRSEFTISRLADGLWGERFFLIFLGRRPRLRPGLPAEASAARRLGDPQGHHHPVRRLRSGRPQCPKVLEKLADADVSNQAFPWLTLQEMTVGFAPGVRALRVNFVGSLGWELHHPIEYQNHLYDALMEAGKEFDIGLAGMRAMDSLRLEKSYRLWGTDLNAENSALEAGLNRFVRLNKGDFAGRDALVRQQEEGVPNTYCTIEIDADDADPFGNEPVFMDGEVVGRGTAGGYGHYVGKSLMLGYVKSDVRRGRPRLRGPRARPAPPRPHHRRKPLRPGERGAQGLSSVFLRLAVQFRRFRGRQLNPGPEIELRPHCSRSRGPYRTAVQVRATNPDAPDLVDGLGIVLSGTEERTGVTTGSD